MRRTIGLVVVLTAACSPSSNGGTDASMVDAPIVKDVATEAACEAPRTLCAGACVDTQTAHRNCGGCGRICDGRQVCVNGTCLRGGVCPPDGSCRTNADCRTCVLEGDPSTFCCSARMSNPRCIREPVPRCPENP